MSSSYLNLACLCLLTSFSLLHPYFTVEGADVENADFTDAYIGDFDIRNLCKNPTLKGENPTTGADTRLSANCKLN